MIRFIPVTANWRRTACRDRKIGWASSGRNIARKSQRQDVSKYTRRNTLWHCAFYSNINLTFHYLYYINILDDILCSPAHQLSLFGKQFYNDISLSTYQRTLSLFHNAVRTGDRGGDIGLNIITSLTGFASST